MAHRRSLGFVTICTVGLLLFASPAAAVIISDVVTGDGSGNKDMPPYPPTPNFPGTDPGWANVTHVGNSSGVYLGDGWVLTASHVGPGTVQLNGASYSYVPGTWTHLHDPINTTTLADLGVFKINGTPSTSTPTVTSTAASLNSWIVAAGNGFNRAAEKTHWDGSWNQVAEGSPDVVHSGFFYNSAFTQALRWGVNRIAVPATSWQSTFADPTSGLSITTTTLGFKTFFDDNGNADEMQAATRDSGGPAFRYNAAASRWELAGTMVVVGNLYTNQPGSTAVYGNSTYMADLSYYRSQILNAIAALANVTWTGATSTTWSTAAGSGNWKKTSDSTAADYANTAAVIFDDSATGSLTVDISSADVSPACVVFNNSVNSFAITGSKGIAGVATVLKQGAAKVTLSSVNNYSGVTTVEGGMLQFNGAAARNPVLNLGGANIKAGTMIFDYAGEGSPGTTIGTLLATSYHSGSATHFDVGKFQSSAADADHGLGWIETMTQQVLVAYTLYGDATVDGTVDISDLSALGQNWNGSGKNWAQGDFNYDGKVDISDLSALGQHWNQSIAGFSGGMGSDPGSVVPEPASLVLVLAFFVALGFWRRGRRALGR